MRHRSADVPPLFAHAHYGPQVVGSIQDPKALKEKVKQLYHKYCADMVAGERWDCGNVPAPMLHDPFTFRLCANVCLPASQADMIAGSVQSVLWLCAKVCLGSVQSVLGLCASMLGLCANVLRLRAKVCLPASQADILAIQVCEHFIPWKMIGNQAALIKPLGCP
eukprot:1140244-Pelagomonas_calceolata.AAC.9